MCMTPHGPDTATFERAILQETTSAPARLPDDSLAFMCAVAACMCDRARRSEQLSAIVPKF